MANHYRSLTTNNGDKTMPTAIIITDNKSLINKKQIKRQLPDYASPHYFKLIPCKPLNEHGIFIVTSETYNEDIFDDLKYSLDKGSNYVHYIQRIDDGTLIYKDEVKSFLEKPIDFSDITDYVSKSLNLLKVSTKDEENDDDNSEYDSEDDNEYKGLHLLEEIFKAINNEFSKCKLLNELTMR